MSQRKSHVTFSPFCRCGSATSAAWLRVGTHRSLALWVLDQQLAGEHPLPLKAAQGNKVTLIKIQPAAWVTKSFPKCPVTPAEVKNNAMTFQTKNVFNGDEEFWSFIAWTLSQVLKWLNGLCLFEVCSNVEFLTIKAILEEMFHKYQNIFHSQHIKKDNLCEPNTSRVIWLADLSDSQQVRLIAAAFATLISAGKNLT